MVRPRFIPVMLIKDNALVKGVNFRSHQYLGDPLNAIRIFNEKQVDELVFLDISAREKGLNFKLLKDIASETFMPISYGGGVSSPYILEKVLRLGFEKIIINTTFFENKNIINECSKVAGSQSVVLSIDVKRNLRGKYEIYTRNGNLNTHMNPKEIAKEAEDRGAGEILITSIDREGSFKGLDNELVKEIKNSVTIPIVANGGVGSVKDLETGVVDWGLSGVAAGSFFSLFGKYNAPLITYPPRGELNAIIERCYE